MTVLDNNVQLRANQLSFSVPWNGEPFITILIPEDDLKRQPKLEIEMTIHKTGDIDHPLPEFANNPFEISVRAMRDSPPMYSKRPDHGGSYKIAPIRVFY